MSCKPKCQEIEIVECTEDDLCLFELPSTCVTIESTGFEFFSESDGEVTLQAILDELDGLLAQGFSGTVANPTSITVVNGVVTDVS